MMLTGISGFVVPVRAGRCDRADNVNSRPVIVGHHTLILARSYRAGDRIQHPVTLVQPGPAQPTRAERRERRINHPVGHGCPPARALRTARSRVLSFTRPPSPSQPSAITAATQATVR
jgi:hypothetical protein